MTCVDCSVTFYGDDYAQHITCVSEAEKYEKTLYKPKQGKANPQDTWNEIIQTACAKVDTAPQVVRPYLQRVADLNNVPRNKKKFINFAKNSLRLYSDNVLEALWTYLDTFRVDAKKETEAKTEAPVAAAKTVPVEEPESAVVESTSAEGSDEERAKKEKKKAKKEKRKREAEEAAAATAESVAATVEAESEEPAKEHKKKKSKKDKQRD